MAIPNMQKEDKALPCAPVHKTMLEFFLETQLLCFFIQCTRMSTPKPQQLEWLLQVPEGLRRSVKGTKGTQALW